MAWRGIFLINVPIGIVVIVMAAKFVPSTAPKAASHIDFRGVMLLGITILSGMFAISYLGSADAPIYSPIFLAGLLVSADWLTGPEPNLDHPEKPIETLPSAPKLASKR